MVVHLTRMTTSTYQPTSSNQTSSQANTIASTPLFTTTWNLDFNSDDEEDYDYNPFAGLQSKDDTTFEDDGDYDRVSIPIESKHTSLDYYDIGDPQVECRHCKALMWKERMDKHRHL
ncbi:hypothetical protein KIW84_045829 [Lathyrus oleraceus]|uniref:Uncharacterized protein n=1 Tax=Pisum sativum TaxID=3888 RepID=A0A9D4XP75_PEA|nr:hypothetical protein KIW84_045829 [Pisum sativum]